MNLLKEQKKIGVITIISGLLALACMYATLLAVNFNDKALADPLLILTNHQVNIPAARWSMIFDMFGYYLLLLPVIYLFHEWSKDKSAWGNLLTFCGLAYVLIGSIGASILAVVWPRIISAYAMASPSQQEILKADFSLVNDIVYNGMWNLLEVAFAASWWTSLGFIMLKFEYKFIGWLTILTGISCLGDTFSGLLQINWLHELSLNLYLLFAILWALTIGIFLSQNKLK